MKTKKIIIISAILILALIVWIFYRNTNINYQLNKLANGNPNQKARAADFLTEKKIYKAIPLMIKNIGNDEVADIYGKSPAEIYCVMFYDLEELVKNNFGFCSNEVVNNDKARQAITDRWQDWYKNEYPAWLETQNNK